MQLTLKRPSMNEQIEGPDPFVGVIAEAATIERKAVDKLRQRLNNCLRGKAEVVENVLICLLARGHLLIEDLPGLGKTTLAKALAAGVGGRFARVQCTPDLLPGDITGFNVFNQKTREFEFLPGPVFADVLLADEINRATPRTQSALLEAMAEGQVTVDNVCHRLSDSFFVIATQNPVEHHGTYPLPESQLDRFLLRLRIGYPDAASERQILRQREDRIGMQVRPVLSAAEVIELQEMIHAVRVEEAVTDYIMAIVERTRAHESLYLGVSPRGAQALYRAAQALALLEGRDYVIPDDVKRLASPVFAHRVVVNPRVALLARGADAGERVLAEILASIEVPL